MALFVLTCIDHEDAIERRMAARPAHLDYVQQNRAMVKVAGPLLNDTDQMAGSMFIIEAEDRAQVEAFSESDPYRLANVFETIEVRAFRVTVGELP